MLKRFYYGWFLVGVGTFCYGFGISPGYYSWGLFAPEIIADLGLSREQIGDVFGVRGLVAALLAPLVGLSLNRFGIRWVVATGALVSAGGFFLLSQAHTPAIIYLSYSVIVAGGMSFSTVLPAQTLAMFWFERYRARATSIIFVGGAIVGALVPAVDRYIVEHHSWRTGWVVIGCTSLVVATVAALFLRNRPEDLGLRRDGDSEEEPPEKAHESEDEAEPSSAAEPQWTAAQAIRRPQFFVLTFAAIANAIPWTVVSVHGRLHLEDLGFGATLVAALLGVRVGISTLGRLAGAAGDFFPAARVLGLALLLAALGLIGLLAAKSSTAGYLAVSLLGLGYGAGYISIPVVFGDYFGRQAFAGTGGARIAILAVALWLAPKWAGASADTTGSYTTAFLAIMVLCVLGAIAAFLCRKPALAPALAGRV